MAFDPGGFSSEFGPGTPPPQPAPPLSLNPAPSPLVLQSYGALSSAYLQAALGTQAAPAPIPGNFGIGELVARGWDGSAYGNYDAALYFRATETHSPTGHGTEVLFFTTPNGSVTAAQPAGVSQGGALWCGGGAALATTATDGFFGVPTMAGAPASVPVINHATAPMVFDTVDKELWVYGAGAWNLINSSGGGGGGVTVVTSTSADLTVANPSTTPTLTVNSAPKWTAGRTLNYTGDIAGSGVLDGSANVGFAMTLPAVNANVGSFGDAGHVAQITVDAKGRITAAGNVAIPPPPAGTVTSVGVTAPAAVFGVAGSPVTAAGNIALSFVNQAQNSVWAGPVSGGAGAPAFRALAAADVAGLVGVTSVGLSAPAMFTVGGSPVTGAGTLALGLALQPNNLVFAGPATGGPLAPTFRALSAADISGGVGVTNVSSANSDLTVANGATTPVLTVNAAPKWDTARTISFTGDVVGTAPVDGSANVAIAMAVQPLTSLTISGAAGTQRLLNFQTSGSLRWQFNCSAALESGGNAGSNFNFQALDDTGAFLFNIFTVTRSNGVPVFPQRLGLTGTTAHGVVVAQGTAAVTSTAAGSVGQVLTSQGAAADPTFTTAAGGQVSGNPNPPAPTATNTMMGLGVATNPCTFTPSRNGRVFIIFTGHVLVPSGATTGSGIIFGLWYGTGTPPAAGAATTGTSVGQAIRAASGIVPTGADYRPFTICAFISGLAVGTTYWADLAQTLIAAGMTANAQNVQFSFMEQ